MDILSVEYQRGYDREYIIHTLDFDLGISPKDPFGGLMIAVSECKTKAGKKPFQ